MGAKTSQKGPKQQQPNTKVTMVLRFNGHGYKLKRVIEQLGEKA